MVVVVAGEIPRGFRTRFWVLNETGPNEKHLVR